MAQDMFGNTLDDEELRRLFLDQMMLGLTPHSVRSKGLTVPPSINYNQVMEDWSDPSILSEPAFSVPRPTTTAAVTPVDPTLAGMGTVGLSMIQEQVIPKTGHFGISQDYSDFSPHMGALVDMVGNQPPAIDYGVVTDNPTRPYEPGIPFHQNMPTVTPSDQNIMPTIQGVSPQGSGMVSVGTNAFGIPDKTYGPMTETVPVADPNSYPNMATAYPVTDPVSIMAAAQMLGSDPALQAGADSFEDGDVPGLWEGFPSKGGNWGPGGKAAAVEHLTTPFREVLGTRDVQPGDRDYGMAGGGVGPTMGGHPGMGDGYDLSGLTTDVVPSMSGVDPATSGMAEVDFNPYGGVATRSVMGDDPTWPDTGGYGTTTTVSLPEILSYAAPLPGLALLSKIPAVGKALTAAEKAMRRNLLKGAGGVAALGAAGQLGKEAVERAIEFGKTGGVETFKDIGFKTVDVLDEFGKTIGFRNVISKGPKKGQKLDPHLKDNIQVRSKKGTDKTPYDWAGAPIGASVAEIVSNAASAPAGALERKAADDARAAAQAEKDRQAQIAAAAAASAITSKRAIAKAKAAANKEKKAAARRAAAAQRALDSARAAAARAAAASAAQAKAAQKAAKAVLARLGQDRNMPSAREVAKAREVLSQIDTFGTGGQRGFMGAEIGIEDGGGYTGGDFSSGAGWE